MKNKVNNNEMGADHHIPMFINGKWCHGNKKGELLYEPKYDHITNNTKQIITDHLVKYNIALLKNITDIRQISEEEYEYLKDNL